MSERYQPAKPLQEPTLVLLENLIVQAQATGDKERYIALLNHLRDFLLQFEKLTQDPLFIEANSLLQKTPITDRSMLSYHRADKELDMRYRNAVKAYRLFQKLKPKYGLSFKAPNVDAEARLVTLDPDQVG